MTLQQFLMAGAVFVLGGLWQAASSIYVLDVWPSAFQWLKIGSSGVVAACGAVCLYMANPQGFWTVWKGPGPK